MVVGILLGETGVPGWPAIAPKARSARRSLSVTKILRNPSSILQHIIAPQARQYIYLFMPHGLYPFSGACASIASMRDIFPRMRIAAASVSFRIPVIRQLIGWINTIPVESRFAAS